MLLREKFYHVTIIFHFIITVVITAGDTDQEWNYDDLGSNLWPKLFPTCGHSKQSPINILRDETVCETDKIRKLNLSNYRNEYELRFKNNWRTLMATPINKGKQILLGGSGLPENLEPFELNSLHFHWGLNEFQGSEHLINNVQYPLELHLVFESQKQKNQLAVIGIMFKPTGKPTIDLSPIITAAEKLQNSSEEKFLDTKIEFSTLLPTNIQEFYFYEGSLTTPPCNETVYWSVLANSVEINSLYLNAFHMNLIKHNYRNVQPLNRRQILTNYCPLSRGGTLKIVSNFSLFSLLMFALIIFILNNF